MNAIDEMVRLLKRLPGMGEKSATRLCYFLIKSDDAFVEKLGESIRNIKRRISTCPICGSFIDESGCPYCNNPERDQSLLCVVEEPQDVMSINQSGAYNGLFHVLGGSINPLQGIGPGKLKLKELKDRVSEGRIKEVIIATNPTEEGDTTAFYIRNMLKENNVKISRLASGLPIGGDLGYADKTTLIRSMRGRVSYSSVPDEID